MQLLLQVVGAIALCVLLALFLGYFALRWWLRWKLGKQGLAFHDHGPQPLAARIHLVRDREPFDDEGTDALVVAFKALGYVAVDTYEVPEMEGVRLWAGFHPSDGLAVAVYEHPALAPWFDVVRIYDSWDTDTVTSSAMHDPSHVAPTCFTRADPGLDPRSAHAAMQALPVRAAVRSIDADTWCASFVELYARSMDYILSGGGPELSTMERNIETFGGPRGMTDAQKQAALEMSRADHAAALETALLDRFLESGVVSAHEWQRLESRVVVVHEKMAEDEVAAFALDSSQWSDDHPPVADLMRRLANSPIELFEAIGELLPESDRHRLLGSVEVPVRARIYVAPA